MNSVNYAAATAADQTNFPESYEFRMSIHDCVSTQHEDHYMNDIMDVLCFLEEKSDKINSVSVQLYSPSWNNGYIATYPEANFASARCFEGNIPDEAYIFLDKVFDMMIKRADIKAESVNS
jgi:hypothetical protein